RQPAHFILKAPRALEMLETLVESFVEADDHRGRCIQSRCDDGTLSLKIFSNTVLKLAVARTEVLGENLGATARYPAHTSLLEPFGGFRIVELRVIGKIHELGYCEGIKLERIAVAFANGSEEIAVVTERQMRIEPAIERGEIPAEFDQ